MSASRPTEIRDHRVDYKNGKFESDDDNFLTGGDTAHRPVIFPFPSVHSTEPQKKWLDFPLLPGKTWRYRFMRTRFGKGTSNAPVFAYGTASAEVKGQFPQIVQTTAGKFSAIEIQRRDPVGSDDSLPLTYYYSPQTKSVIKSTAHTRYRYSIGYQFDLELIAYGNEGDGKVVNAPVYRDGDWWVFRIRIIDYRGATNSEVHRVMFKNDKFDSDDPSFLTGGDVAGTPHFLPFASVYLTDPARRWLDFPLMPGKTWSFRYIRRNFLVRDVSTHVIATANAKVIGKASHLIETPAGKFEAIEISRTDNVNGPASLTYFYSPRSQSVVKLRAEIFKYDRGQFELELIAYGNGGNMGKGLR